MYIYSVYHTQSGRFGICSVCVAMNEEEAVQILNLDQGDTDVRVTRIGKEIDGELSEKAWVVLQDLP